MKQETIVILTKGLSRDFKRPIKEEGLSGSIKSLFKRKYDITRAVGDFALEVQRGEILGVIGPNGAGKTTLVKLLTGIISPSEGSSTVLGFQPRERKHEFLSRIAVVMGQKSQLWWELPPKESFLLNKALYGIPEARFRESLARLACEFSVESLLEVPVRSLSLGERMKMEFIAAMLHEPEILFLDEPTIGLDAPAQKAIRGFLKKENAERGLTILLTSHYMDDIRLLCPRAVVIRKGRKTYDGGIQELFGSVRDSKIVRISFGSETSIRPEEIPGALIMESGPYSLSFRIPSEATSEALSRILPGRDVADLAVEEEEIADSVEKIYMKGEKDA